MASEEFQPQDGNEELWRTIFAVGHPDLQKQHWLHRKLPTRPRCRLCLVPFSGIGGWIMRMRGKGRNNRNPNFCNACDKFLEAFPGGVEIEMSMLYVDIRQSTEYADGHEAASVSQRINAFLNHATRTVTDHDGFVMAFTATAWWPPGHPASVVKVMQKKRMLRRWNWSARAALRVTPVNRFRWASACTPAISSSAPCPRSAAACVTCRYSAVTST